MQLPLKSSLLVELSDAALAADYTQVRRCIGKLAAALAAEGDSVGAAALRARARSRGVPLRASGYVETLPVDGKSRLPLLEEQSVASQPIFLNAADSAAFHDFVEDARHATRLSQKGIASRLCLLLSGPPGSGKSLLASHVASQLQRSFYVVRLDSAISSLLGDTAKNVRAIFDFVPKKGAVLFLDEMDAIAKVRDDKHELGEVKRVVNTVLQGLDALDHEAVVIAATNHPHLLDPAIWRRFPYKIDLGLPDLDVRQALWSHFMFEDKEGGAPLAPQLAKMSEGLSGADIETISHAARRHALIGKREIDLAAVAHAVQHSKAGKPTLPPRNALDRAQLHAVITTLAKDDLNAADIGRLVGITRQAVRYHLNQATPDAE
jgi:hypothetical protein